eukprot:scaffold206123_cov23-Tisochrysis_lutea.AAC.1
MRALASTKSGGREGAKVDTACRGAALHRARKQTQHSRDRVRSCEPGYVCLKEEVNRATVPQR